MLLLCVLYVLSFVCLVDEEMYVVVLSGSSGLIHWKAAQIFLTAHLVHHFQFTNQAKTSNLERNELLHTNNLILLLSSLFVSSNYDLYKKREERRSACTE